MPTPDHPHTRGENAMSRFSICVRHGPSPHAWGKPDIMEPGLRDRRTIPTRVGKTVPSPMRPSIDTDHPHTRGENGSPSWKLAFLNGPSPHAWGKPTAVGQRCMAQRTIPTRVGKTQSCQRRAAFSRTIPTRVGKTSAFVANRFTASDHPHTRGENHSKVITTVPVFGPSPHAWGKHIGKDIEQDHRRTIPTRVGKPT